MIDIGIIILILIMFCYFYKKIEKLNNYIKDMGQVRHEPDEKLIKKQEEIRKHFENLMNYDEEQAMKRK